MTHTKGPWKIEQKTYRLPKRDAIARAEGKEQP